MKLKILKALIEECDDDTEIEGVSVDREGDKIKRIRFYDTKYRLSSIKLR